MAQLDKLHLPASNVSSIIKVQPVVLVFANIKRDRGSTQFVVLVILLFRVVRAGSNSVPTRGRHPFLCGSHLEQS